MKTQSIGKLLLKIATLAWVLGICLAIVWFGGYVAGRVFGLIEVPLYVVGTGSMYPTFPKGQGTSIEQQETEIVATPYMLPYPNGIPLFGKRLLGNALSRGDIVSIDSKKTVEIAAKTGSKHTGLVKRLVGLPGDTIELRGGLVYLNTVPLREPYIARARSTFGGKSLIECTKLTIPQQKAFVMGDNRKGSLDSRFELGLVDIADIHYHIPVSRQKNRYDTNYRDIKSDLSESAKISLDISQYITLLNQKRVQAGVKPFIYREKLSQSAAKRGEVMLKNNDFSFEATKSAYTMQKALDDVGYFNIVYGESHIQGYYDADELIEYLFEFPDDQKFMLNKEYEDVGVAQIEGQINGCPTQVIVQHFAGYKPPNYENKEIDGWKKVLENMQQIAPSWQRLKENTPFYEQNKQDVDRINTVIQTRITNISEIVQKMEANQWLSKQQVQYTYEDEQLYKELQTLGEKLNNR